MMIIMRSMINVLWVGGRGPPPGVGLYDHLVRTIIFTLIINKMFVPTPKIMRKIAIASI
jgi:hypothetical protein